MMKILIVDDELVSRKKAEKILSSYGACDTAVNGEEALAAFIKAHKDKAPYDLITLDINMPDISGIEALKLIRSKEKDFNVPSEQSVKIIMITIENKSSSILPSFNEGCEAYITKPFNRENILSLLHEEDLI